MKEFDYTVVIFKVAILFLIRHWFISIDLLRNYEFWGAFGRIFFAVLMLAFPVLCFFAARRTPESEDTKKNSRFVIRLFGLYVMYTVLGGVPLLFKILMTHGSSWQYNFMPALREVMILLYGISLVAIPGVWNWLIITTGKFLRVFLKTRLR
jgi:hypothetical protein